MKKIVRDKLRRRYPASTPGLLAQGEFVVQGGGRLRAKVLVFEHPRHLQRFFADVLGRPLGSRCLGAVTSMGTSFERVGPDGKTEAVRWEVDRRCFCLIGLCREHLTMRVLSHEAVHAGFCHARRCSKTHWDAQALAFDEEAVAYPAGEIARELVVFLERVGILEKQP